MDDLDVALAECGVTSETLSTADVSALDEQGYLVFDDLIDAEWLQRLRDALESAFGPRGGELEAKPSGTRHMDDLAYKEAVFDGVYTHPKVLASVHHILQRQFRVFQFNGRDPLPGYGQQGLHNDWMPRMPGEPFSVVTAAWFLDDFKESNGATRLVPGSHSNPRPLPKSMQAPESRHPDEKLIIAPAGTVLVFNGHVWHGGRRNNSQERRRALQCQYVASDLVRPPEQRSDIPARLAPVNRYFLGI